MAFASRWIFVGAVLAVTFAYSEGVSKPCILRSNPNGQVCVCNATYCDTLEEPLTPVLPDQIVVLSTGETGTPFAVSYEQFTKYDRQLIKFNGTDNVVKGVLTVNEQTKFQTIIGFGGAHTGAVTYLLQKLPQSLQDYFYESYYSLTKGIGYTMTRVPIGGSDFDLKPWVYNEVPENDKRLSNFKKLDKRDEDRNEQLKRIKLVTGQTNIKYLGSAWSSPNWMKPNHTWNGLSYLLPEYYDTWAEYHIRFLQLMKYAGIDFWGITTGNEPLNGNVFEPVVSILELGWNAENQAKWVGDFLGPKLRSSDVSHVKILAGDDQRYTFPTWFQDMDNANSKALNYVDGFAVHFYMDSITPSSLLDDTKRQFPSQFILNTESCLGVGALGRNGPLLGSWARAQTYITSYIQDLTHSGSGWIDWNLMLDTIGGPNYVKNYVDAAIIIDTTSGEMYKQPMFYVIGHFSRLITEGSVRIALKSTNEMVMSIGFRRPDGNIVLILFNQHVLPIEMTVLDDNRKVVLTIPPVTIQSVVYRSLNLY